VQASMCGACESVEQEGLFMHDGYPVFQCQSCGLVFLNPQPSDEVLSRIYSADLAGVPHLAGWGGRARSRFLRALVVGCVPMKLHRQARVVYTTQYHLVWVTRYRRNILVRGIAGYLKQAIREVREFHPDWMIEEMGVEPDHGHPHMIMPPK